MLFSHIHSIFRFIFLSKRYCIVNQRICFVCTIVLLCTSGQSRIHLVCGKRSNQLGGLSSQDCWYQQLFSEENPSCMELAESYNNFLVGLTSHFQPLDDCETSEPIEVPGHFLVDIGKVSSTLRLIKTTKSPV